MTNKEAIEYIKNGARCNGDCEYCEKCTEVKYRQALELAIKALEFVEENFPKTFIDYINGVQI